MNRWKMPLVIRSLKGIGELCLQQGTITVIIGPNGAGKTRLLEIAAGLRDPDAMDIVYGNERMWIPGRSRTHRRNPAALLAYSYASQMPEEQLFSRTAAGELAYVLNPYGLTEGEKEDRIGTAMFAVGWDRSRLQQDPFRMSGGERRRLALACLFAVPSPWLLLDEPTAGLDAAGCNLLATGLKQFAAGGQGVLMVSHELDWALPLADTVLLMAPDGTVRRCGRDDILTQPQLLADSGMSVPGWLRIARELVNAGVPAHKAWNPKGLAAETMRIIGAGCERTPKPAPAQGPAASAQGPEAVAHGPEAPAQGPKAVAHGPEAPAQSPEAMAQRPAPARRRERTAQEPVLLSAQESEALPAQVLPTALPEEQTHARLSCEARRADASSTARREGEVSPLSLYDPRSVWLFYMMVSAAIFAQRTWTGIALSTLLTAAVIAAFRIPLRRWRGAITALGLFSLTVSVLSGLGVNAAGGIWDMGAFLQTLRSLIRPWLAMLLGFGLPMVMTPLRLRRTLIRLLSIRGRVPEWGQYGILAVTLLLRFIPVLLKEWERFTRIAVARGKNARASWRGAARWLRDTAIPFLLSLFRLGENAASALESRGVGSRRDISLPEPLKWQWRDSLLLAGGAIASLLLWGLGRGFIG